MNGPLIPAFSPTGGEGVRRTDEGEFVSPEGSSVSDQQVFDHVPVHVGEAEVTALMEEG